MEESLGFRYKGRPYMSYSLNCYKGIGDDTADLLLGLV